MGSYDVKTQLAVALREVATDIESGWFESNSVSEFFQEIDISIRYQLGRHHGDEMKYLPQDPPVNSLQSLHNVWMEKKKMLSKMRNI